MAVDWLPEPGETLDERYKLGEQSGVGPTGAVYSATRLSDGMDAIVKVFHPELFGGQVRGPNTMRLQRARLMRAAGLVTLEEIDVREGSAFVVMPRIESPTLLAWLAERGAPGEEVARQIVDDVGATLEVIHQLGVHGDIKPSNIYIDDDFKVLVSDPWFLEGLAGIRDAAGLAPRADTWLAPEQTGGTWQERPETDIYRLALLLGWLLGGAEVVGGRALTDQGVTCTAELDEVFLRATQEDPGERFGQVRGFLDALASIPWVPDAVEEEPALEDGAEATVDPLAETVGHGMASPLRDGGAVTGQAEFLQRSKAVELAEDVADETLEDATPGEPKAEDDERLDAQAVEDDPAATRVLRQESVDEAESSADEPEGALVDEEPGDPEDLADQTHPDPRPQEMQAAEPSLPEQTDVESRLAGQSAESANEAGIGRSLDNLTRELSDADGPPTRPGNPAVQDSTGEDTVRRGSAISDVEEHEPEEAHERDSDLSRTRKQAVPVLNPTWRTNPIMVVGPGMLALSLLVALLVLDKIQDDRQAAAAFASAAQGLSKTETARDPARRPEKPNQDTESAAKAPKPASEPSAKPAPSEAEAGDSAGDAPERKAPEESAKPAADASANAAPVDHRSLKCPNGMIKVRRAPRKTDGAAEKTMAVWCIDRYEFPGKGRTPRTGVDVEKAQALCAEAGKRLCTRREWGVACGGKYPYKGEFDPDACNSAAPGPTARSLKPSGAKLRCVSGWGAYDMVGNVAEWTSDGKINGGSAKGDAAGGTCYRSVPRASGGSDVGFRCCAEPNPMESPK